MPVPATRRKLEKHSCFFCSEPAGCRSLRNDTEIAFGADIVFAPLTEDVVDDLQNGSRRCRLIQARRTVDGAGVGGKRLFQDVRRKFLAIWQQERREFLLTRDRFGIVCLYGVTDWR